MRPRFLLDEHVNPAIQRQLHRLSQEINVRCVGQPNAPRKGTSDSDLLSWAEENRFILVSEDRRTLPTCLAAAFDERASLLRDSMASPEHPNRCSG